MKISIFYCSCQIVVCLIFGSKLRETVLCECINGENRITTGSRYKKHTRTSFNHQPIFLHAVGGDVLIGKCFHQAQLDNKTNQCE